VDVQRFLTIVFLVWHGALAGIGAKAVAAMLKGKKMLELKIGGNAIGDEGAEAKLGGGGGARTGGGVRAREYVPIRR
jgi:hypothetical protein